MFLSVFYRKNEFFLIVKKQEQLPIVSEPLEKVLYSFLLMQYIIQRILLIYTHVNTATFVTV